MTVQTHVKIPGSDLVLSPEATRKGPVADHETVEIIVLVRRRKPPAKLELSQDAGQKFRRLSREEFREHFGADTAELKKVAQTLEKAGFRIVETDVAKRSVIASGPASAANATFGAQLSKYSEPDGRTFRSYKGALHVPTEIAALVEGVFGLNESVQILRRFRVRPQLPPPPATPLTIPQITAAYKFPPPPPGAASGAGQTIGFIEGGGAGFLTSDMTTFFTKRLGLAASPTIVIGGGTNAMVADEEATSDLEVAGGAAPGATLAVYFAASGLYRDFFGAIQTAVHDSVNNPSVISISGGISEDLFGFTDMDASGVNGTLSDAVMMGITVCVASGDNGATSPDQVDGNPHCGFPASSPLVLAVGGTDLRLGRFGPFETVWNDRLGASGGGISTRFAVPPYQMGVGLPASVNPSKGPGRGVPDVAGDASPMTGYMVVIGGQDVPMGGTSLSTPLWAALIACLNQILGFRLGFVNPHLYALRGSKAFTDITLGNNDIGNDQGGYAATPGWDCCTGLGTPVGTELLNAFASSTLIEFFPPNQITCGYPQDALLVLDKPDTIPITVQLRSDDPSVVSVPSSTTILPGNSSWWVTFTAPAIKGPFPPKFVNVHASVGFSTLTAKAEVVPPRIVSVTLAPSSITSGDTTQCEVSLDRASLDGSVVVELFSSDPFYAPVPPDVTLNQGQGSATFTIATPAIQTPFGMAHASILAVYRSGPSDPGTSAAATLTIEPLVLAGIVGSLVLNPTTITAGANSHGSVTLINWVPTPTNVTILALDPFANPLLPDSAADGVSVPPSLPIQPGHTLGQFTITTSTSSGTLGHQRKVTIMAAAAGLPVSATLTIEGS